MQKREEEGSPIFGDERFNSTEISFAIGKMHAYAHGIQCLRAYHPLRVVRCGLTCGEACERIWSYLGKFGTMTKSMHASGRHEQLEDAMKRFRDLKIDQLPSALSKSKDVCVSTYTKAIQDFSELKALPNGGKITIEIAQLWFESELRAHNNVTYILHEANLICQDGKAFASVTIPGNPQLERVKLITRSELANRSSLYASLRNVDTAGGQKKVRAVTRKALICIRKAKVALERYNGLVLSNLISAQRLESY